MAVPTHPVGNCQSRGSAHTCLASHNGPIVPERARRRLPAAPWAWLTLCLPAAGCRACVEQEGRWRSSHLPCVRGGELQGSASLSLPAASKPTGCCCFEDS